MAKRQIHRFEVLFLLILSYMLASGLELSLLAQCLYQEIYWLAWSFGFLALASLLSLAVENTNLGKMVRREMKATQMDIERYDLLSNLLRSVLYLLATFGMMTYVAAAIGAYGVLIICLLWGSKNLMKKL